MELITTNLAQLNALKDVIAELGDRQYAAASKLPQEASIGRHSRHVLEHYSQLILALKNGLLDYSERRRDPILETQPQAALTRIDEIQETLGAIDSPYAHPLIYQSGTTRLATNLARELDFVCSHTIHHLALIRIIMTDFGVEAEPSIGVHASTLEYQQKCAP
ncbi:hypothetical protein CWE09_13870 [Aliidiomarina minuta]|uniref:DinB family protein n=1 Tax=Aliidiomarina minuta TaxID=880057 RepID=A0A432W1B5_9GAMM|nr:hypothetical protein [Aliidiomarina minuta]RUO23014.1 hypothetical protein CWE09_13870 [Aliidiomarina minuta]